MSPCHNLEPSLVARDSSRLLSVKPNEWMHLSPFYTRMHGEWLRYAKSTSQFYCRFLLVRDVRGFQVNPLCRHDITSPFPPSGNGGYVRNLDVPQQQCCQVRGMFFMSAGWSDLNNVIFSPWNANLPGEPRQTKPVYFTHRLNAIFNGQPPSKHDWASFE